ncbi:hypothetical protein EV359DRAFT_66568 [Lentinula novae-zelandiae]|nr:hypothetical protein EV359DRAFT_66568 [Lentinula novae-zelandiae]
MHVFFVLSPSNAKRQLLYAYFLLVAVLSVTVFAAPLKLAPRPLAPNVVVLSLGWDETTAFFHGEQRPALFFYNNYGLTARRDPYGRMYIYPLQRSAKGLQNLGPDNTQLIAYFRDEVQLRSTMATFGDLQALSKLGAGPQTMSWPLIINARDYVHAVLTLTPAFTLALACCKARGSPVGFFGVENLFASRHNSRLYIGWTHSQKNMQGRNTREIRSVVREALSTDTSTKQTTAAGAASLTDVVGVRAIHDEYPHCRMTNDHLVPRNADTRVQKVWFIDVVQGTRK